MLTRRDALAAGLAQLAAPAWGAAADYAGQLASAWGGPLDPAQVHREVAAAAAAAQARADRLLRGQGLTQGGVAERLRTLAADPRHLYPDDDAGRDRAVADMNARLAAIVPNLRTAFGDLPLPRARVRRMSPADVAAGRGGFREPDRDGVPGAYYVDLQHIRERPAWSLPTVAFHEVTPGHLLQMSLQQPGRDGGAFFEAWATYAEQLCADLGAYRGDPLGESGYLHWRLFRLGRAVADTGLGALGWSRAQAVEALTGYQGQSVAFISIEADVERMLKTPGRVAADGLGALRLAQWRPRARADWPAWHRLVLTGSPWTFADLEKRLRA
jgi:uncharacterized protein (DUF885 family)